MELRNVSKTAAKLIFLVVVFALPAQPALAETSASAGQTYEPAKIVRVTEPNRAQPGITIGNFAEVEITLDDEVTLSDISALPRAPGSDLEVLDGGKRVRLQLPADRVEALVEEGTQVAVLRNFVLVEGVGSDGEVTPLAACSGSFYYGENPLRVYIQPSNTWCPSGLDFSLAPGGHTVACIDVHYEVKGLDWASSIVDVELSDADDTPIYLLVDGWWGFYGDIVETQTGITTFNGQALSQLWILWAIDYFATGGYIHYWWIKLYFEDEPPPPPDYCDATGDCTYGLIRDVVVGSINNTDSGCGDGYSDYTSLSATMKIGAGCPITVVNGAPWADDLCGIWVDWNQDKDFEDASETISVTGSPGIGPYTATITPPADANLGDTRMRVRIMYWDNIGPCDIIWGEVEDYTITVMPESWLLGDFIDPNGVDMRDFLVLAAQWKQAPGKPSADIAPGCGDGIVDWLDVKALAEN